MRGVSLLSGTDEDRAETAVIHGMPRSGWFPG